MRVVIVQSVALEPFERAIRTLRAELEDDYDVRVLSVEPGDPKSRSELYALSPDVIVPVGTQATSWVTSVTDEVPIVFSMVLDPVAGGFVSSFGQPGGYITGAALDIPYSIQFQTARRLLSAERIAVLYSPAHSGKRIESAVQAAKQAGIHLVPIAVESPAAFERALRRVDDSFDALWAVPDTMVFSRRLAERILIHTIRRRIPLVGLSEQHVRAGALYSLVTSYEENGRQAADLVRRVASGERPSRIALRRPENLEVVFNPRTAENMRMRMPRTEFARLRPVR